MPSLSDYNMNIVESLVNTNIFHTLVMPTANPHLKDRK